MRKIKCGVEPCPMCKKTPLAIDTDIGFTIGCVTNSCCGEQMWLDNLSWFADKYDEYVCHKCGKRKLIKKKEAENERRLFTGFGRYDSRTS